MANRRCARSLLALLVCAARGSGLAHGAQPQRPLQGRQTASRLVGADKPTVWGEFGVLARETGAVNLGQGYPDWEPPEFVMQAARDALGDGIHQYTRSAGHPPLVDVLAERYTHHFGRPVCPDTEIAVTVGASQGLFLTLQALVDPGDEVLLIEPAFDLYYGQIRVAGGTAVGVPMTLDDGGEDGGAAREWHLDLAALEAAITPASRVLVLNSPHNPTGKVFSRAEMEAVAALVARHPRLIVISDEVYKYTVHGEGHTHVHFSALPGMAERTVTVSSAGKTFSVTGWQVGWCVGPAELIRPIQLYLPYTQFCVASPMQAALARALRKADERVWTPLPPPSVRAERAYAAGTELVDYYAYLRSVYAQKRERLAAALRAAGIAPLACEGGVFMMADTSALSVPEAYLRESTPAAPTMTRDWALCRYLAIEHGVLMIPASPFFASSAQQARGAPNPGESLARVAFCKSDETLAAAAERLAAVGAAAGVSGSSLHADGRAAERAARTLQAEALAAAAQQQ